MGKISILNFNSSSFFFFPISQKPNRKQNDKIGLRYYIHKIFITLSQQILCDKIVISSYLSLILTSFFYSPRTTWLILKML